MTAQFKCQIIIYYLSTPLPGRKCTETVFEWIVQEGVIDRLSREIHRVELLNFEKKENNLKRSYTVLELAPLETFGIGSSPAVRNPV